MLIFPFQTDLCYCVALKLTDMEKSTKKTLYLHEDSAFLHVQLHSHQHTHTHTYAPLFLVAGTVGGWFPIGLRWQWMEKTGLVHTPPNRRRCCTCIKVHALFMYNSHILTHTHTPRSVNMGQQEAAQRRSHLWSAGWNWSSWRNLMPHSGPDTCWKKMQNLICSST